MSLTDRHINVIEEHLYLCNQMFNLAHVVSRVVSIDDEELGRSVQRLKRQIYEIIM